MTLDDLPTTPINWSKFFISYTSNIYSSATSNITLISYPDLFQKLGHLLKTTASRTVVNYLHWKLIESVADLVIEPKLMAYRTLYSEKSTSPPRWKFCLDLVRQRLPVSVNALFVRRYFHESTKKAVEKMVENIRRQLADQFSATTWLQPRERNVILKRLNEVRATIGAPDELHNVTVLQQYYSSLDDLSEHMFLESTFRVNIFNDKQNFANAQLPINQSVTWADDYLMNVSKISANYENHINSICKCGSGILLHAYK